MGKAARIGNAGVVLEAVEGDIGEAAAVFHNRRDADGRRQADDAPSQKTVGKAGGEVGDLVGADDGCGKTTQVVIEIVEVLWLLKDNPAVAANLRREAAARGIVPDRLVFAARTDPATHLARQGLADLFLDTLPYNAHTTASDALWVGLPVLTLMGSTFAGRVAASVLHAVNLPELVTTSLGEYEALALK